jgi:Holliday junction DNA helicase RuvB
VHGDGAIDLAAARAALKLYDVDELGLDRLDRAVLETLCRRFGGGPVGLSTLAVAVGEETETVETVAEPYLVREGLLVRTPRGRAATQAAWEHIGMTAPALSGQAALPFGEPRQGRPSGDGTPGRPGDTMGRLG